MMRIVINCIEFDPEKRITELEKAIENLENLGVR
jgi:hypothetical protein